MYIIARPKSQRLVYYINNNPISFYSKPTKNYKKLGYNQKNN